MLRYSFLPALLLLPACSLFDNSDPREGAEGADTCIQRVTQLVDELPADGTAAFVPTFTYDITKMDLEAIQGLMVPGSDDTAGARLNLQTNEQSTAVARFMEEPVDDSGSFFMSRDPALYRVRGEPNALADIIVAGCDRQQENMRLIDVSVAPTSAAPTSSNSSSENETEN